MTDRNITIKYQTLYFLLGLILSISITIIRYVTGPEFQISQFYLIPIIIVTWYVGRSAGIIIATISILFWLIFDYFTIQSLALGIAPGLNEIFRLIIFILIIQLVHKSNDLIGKLQELAGTDPLTLISNRRSFFKSASQELERAKRYNHVMSLLYIDLDNFKTVNDTKGHLSGDKLLKIVAENLLNNTRQIDLVARMGGDEFCVLLVETGREEALKAYEKLQTEILTKMHVNEWPVTLSSGIVTFYEQPESVKEMVSQADIIMYSVKRSGKNNLIQKDFGTFKKNRQVRNEK
jgi:diguanylate cyclase (GGDEF)-like protein